MNDNLGLSLNMKKFFLFPAIIALALFGSCQKQQTEAERNAEVERQVQERLAAERQTQEQQTLAQRVAELEARQKTGTDQADQQETAVPAPARSQSLQHPTSSLSKQMRDSSGRTATASYSTFYTKLEPHGAWRQTSDYGYVWQPREAEQSRQWRPYTNGHWAYTESGWTWISDEPFGWATYHYGRWTRLQNIGWVWVPGDEWAPAWVSWRKSNDYVGWAPLPPEARFERERGIHNWSDNYYDIGPDQYSFVATRELGAPRMDRSVVPVERNVTIINETTNVTNITYKNTTVINQGPNYDELRTRTQQPIPRLRLERQVAFNIDADPRAVVKGEVVEMPAPVIAVAQPVERPTRVKETIAHVTIDRGWERITDRNAADKARVKIKSEAAPPADAPSRTFVKPDQSAGEAGASTSSAQSTTASPATSSTIAPSATAKPSFTAAATATATPSATIKPSLASPTATATPSPLATTTPLPSATLTPAPRSTPSTEILPRPLASPSLAPGGEQKTSDQQRMGGTFKSKAQERHPRRIVPMESPAAPTASPTPPPSTSSAPEITPASASASPPPAQFGRPREQRTEQRILQRQQNKAERSNAPAGQASPSEPAGTPLSSPSASATPLPSEAESGRKEEKGKKKRQRERAMGAEETASPSPSTPPQ
jgi:hypothetical protein